MSDTVLKTISFKPGIDKDDTEYGAEGRWVDCDKVRWRGELVEKFGGWVAESTEQLTDETVGEFTGIARDIHSWIDLDFEKYLCVASHLKVELLHNNIIYDITPVQESHVLNNAISTTDGSALVTITDSGHGRVVGDYIYVTDQDSAVGGITLDGEYVVASVTDSSNYVINAGTNANATVAGGGGNLDVDYLLLIGSPDNGSYTGYGGGTWNTEGEGGAGYNRPRDGESGLFARMWSLDNWGEDLIACMRNGKVYQWVAADGVLDNRLEVITNAPTENLFMLIAQPSRHLVVFGTQLSVGGTFDPLTIRWASGETRTTWTPADDNTAGEYRLPLGNYIVGAVQTKSEILVFTDTSVFSMRYVGGTEVFRFDILGDSAGILSQNAAVDVDGVVFWIANGSFYIYDGAVRTLPSSIQKYLFDDDSVGAINLAQKEKTYVSTNKEFHEIIGFYPSVASDEIDRYFVYNYVTRVFYIGTFDRTVWLDATVFTKPYAVSSDGTLFVHETGKNDDGSAMLAFITSAYFDIEDGEELMFLDKIVPDIRMPLNRPMTVTIYAKKYPNSTTTVTKGPFPVSSTTTKINPRVRGRQMAIKYESNASGGDFQLGKVRISFQPDGGR